jgi:2-polyprenyl-3-methyl-5-hydroxy-6-metoxy-1,4-benzoquinol methylase
MNVYLEEYSSEDAVRKYTSQTAGYGIRYLLANDYAQVYLTAVDEFLKVRGDVGLRLLEFGCGGGMNIITLLALLERKGRKVDLAVGTDFSERLITAARNEADMFLTPEQQKRIRFAVARNDELASDLAAAMNASKKELEKSFQVILGVNTFRYCHRLGKELNCAKAIADLLMPGGISIMIDMNRKFPAFRSKLRRSPEPPEERYLPTLDEYASPFAKVGLEILRKENFCWIPHSASPALTTICRLSAPALNMFAKPFAMRSLVISRKIS